MTSIINASTSSGLVYTADNSGQLAVQTNGLTALTVDSSQNVSISKFYASSGNISGVAGSNPAMSVGSANSASGGSFYTSGVGTENDIGVQLNGYASAYLYNSTTSWGLYSSAGGTILSYTRATGAVSFNGNATTATTASTANGLGGEPFNDVASGLKTYTLGSNGGGEGIYQVNTNQYFTKGLGFGGTAWTDVTGIRALDTTYQNTNAYPIQISVTCIPPNPPYVDQYGTVQIVINGLLIGQATSTGRGSPVPCNMTVIVPSGAYYYASGTILQQWTELY
jgi:hypothetical protein